MLTVGLALTAVAGLGAVFSSGPVWLTASLFGGGMAAASTNAASGRVVVGWFPAHRRGLAMGIRQMAQPLGVGVAAITIPPVAQAHGIGAALALPTLAAVVVAAICALVVVDPPRPTRAQAAESGQLANPYRSGGFLWRVHGVSVGGRSAPRTPRSSSPRRSCRRPSAR